MDDSFNMQNVRISSQQSPDNAAARSIASSMPSWLLESRDAHRLAMRTAAKRDLPWYHQASAAQRRVLKNALEASWQSRNQSDRIFGRLKEIEAFAESLLIEALNTRFGITVDIRATYLRTYRSTGLAGGFEVRTVSLLEAALNNFEAKETRAGYFDAASSFITRPSATGQFEIVPIKSRLSVEAFASLCRELDIGLRYQTYLDGFFDFTQPVLKARLKLAFQACEEDALVVASELALMKGDIDSQTHAVLLRLSQGHRSLTLGAKALHCHTVAMMGVDLNSILLISADLEGSRSVESVIAYVPHDPHHPIRCYPSAARFAAVLTDQLRDPAYQQFFSRFVPHRHRGNFFFQLNERLVELRWHAPVPGSQQPTWRPEPVASPDLRLTSARIVGDVWDHAFTRHLNRLFADARTRAVPTGDEDAKSRWVRWDSFQKVVVTVLEVGAFVAAPFVPVLGELMLAYTAYQLLDETFEGIVEWSEGQRTEAAEHVLGVVEDLIQLGALAAAGSVLGALKPLKSSPWIERMEVVDSGEGRSRLRIAEPETILPQDPVRIDETPLGTGDMPSLEQRFKTLYPQSTEESFNAFARESGTPSRLRQRIGEQEQSFQALNDTLDGWVAIERGDLLPMDQRYHKGRFAEAIKRCWQAAHTPWMDGFTLDLDFHWTSDFLEYLPALDVEFPYVSALQFRSAELHSDIGWFLDYFPNLKSLDLSDNSLVALPRLQGKLKGLESLDVSGNQLTLSAEGIADLAALTNLQTLNLGSNPALSLAPDISRMAELGTLDLHDSNLNEWPTGLFALPRPRGFELDLRGNSITRLPEVMPGSEQARLVARTRLNRDQLPDQVREQFRDYMRSVGYDPARSYPPKGEQTCVHWLEGMADAERLSRQAKWDELEAQDNAQGFFEVLEQLTESADYTNEASRPELVQRVWRMLEGAAQDVPLREELFRMASNPESCADAGAQIFNEMGIKVLIREAWLAGTPEEVESALVQLAKGKSRLDQVNDIARATVRRRLDAGEHFVVIDEDGEMTGTIDEVEIYLAFQTGLAERLDLPWQSRGILFREVSEVTEAQIDQACESVLALEAGDGLVNRMIEQRFWRKYLKGRHAQAYAQNSLEFNARAEELLSRYTAGTVTQQAYEQGLLALAEERKALLKNLTQSALNKVT
jgi:hypothetical protein